MKTFINYFLNKRWVLRMIYPFLSKEKQEKIAINRLRAELLFWGIPTFYLTNEELKDLIICFGDMIVRTNFTADEVCNAMKTIAQFDQSN